MRRFGLPFLVLALLAGAGDAHAQGFFERLFGLTPSRPPPPAVVYPAPGPVRPELPYDDGPPRPRAPPPPVLAKPVAIKPPSEETVIGRNLRQNGSSGTLRIERTQRGDLRARLTVIGRKAARSVETCTVTIGGGDQPLVSLGRPEGTPRYQLADAVCPLQLDVVDEAVIVKGPAEMCTFTAADCQADPSGMWGPEPGQLLGRARDFEQTRASVDKAVRENYKVLTQRAKPEGIRPIVAEQAAFSADRETMCRSYAREPQHSFCDAKFTEARALALATKLGVTTTASTSEARSRRRGPATSDLPSSDEILQRRPDDPDDD